MIFYVKFYRVFYFAMLRSCSRVTKYTVKNRGLLTKFMPSLAKIQDFYKKMRKTLVYILICIETNSLLH